MISRDPAAAALERHDLIVIGGGAYGIMLTLEAARRGLRPLLVERADFGGATSWNSLRIVHGGLRYLQTLDLTRLRQSVQERSWFLRAFPDQVRPLDCLMPLYGDGLKRPGALRVALAATDLMTSGRNRSLDAAHQIGRGAVLGAAETVRHFEMVPRDGLRGAALWQDAVMADSQRLLIESLRWATSAGAAALNYTDAFALLVAGDRVTGIAARDRISGDEFELRAPVVVNCGGPWSASLAARFDQPLPRLFRPSLALNLFLDRAPLAYEALAVAPRRPGARMCFMYPWKGGVLAGTWHAPWADATRDDPGAVEAAVAAMLRELNDAVPGWSVARSDVVRVHWGLLPARAPGTADLATRPVLHDHGGAGGPDGLYSASGVKFTTARRVGAALLGHIARRRQLPSLGLPRARRPEPVTPPDADAMIALATRNRPAAAAWVRQLAVEESVCHVDDLLLRRTDWGVHPLRAGVLGPLVAELFRPLRVSGSVEAVP